MDRPVSVVRIIVPDDKGKVLILKRAHTDYSAGGWCLPGGKVDYGKLVEESVADELSEETSLKCLSCKFLFYQDSLPLEPGGMHCINFYFECRCSGEVRLNEESSDFAWIERQEMAEYNIVFNNDAGMKQYWQGME